MTSISGFIDYLTDPFIQGELLDQAWEHLKLSVIPMAIATLIAIPLGIMAHRVRWLRALTVNTAATMLTIPSLALFGLLIGPLGIGNPPVIVALVLYAQLPIVRNTLSGLRSVDGSVVESARGMGMNTWQRLIRIELPNSWPVIMAGIRVAMQITVGIATIAVLIGGTGLGEEIYSNGIRRIGSPGAEYAIFGGTLAIVLLAFLLDGVLQIVERVTTSKGIR